jgi:hypothetical protein
MPAQERELRVIVSASWDNKTEEQRALNRCRRRSRDQTQSDRRCAEGLLMKPIDFTLLKEEIDTRLERAS